MNDKDGKEGTVMRMQCMPLYSLILALGNPTIDFLSLDIEGWEYEVLLTLPWQKVDIKAISVETHHQDQQTTAAMFSLLLSAGFTHLGHLARDDVFVRLSARGVSPPVSLADVLAWRPPRLCKLYSVARPQLSQHCATHWPRDFHRPLAGVPGCLGRSTTPWSLASLVESLWDKSLWWRLALSGGCSYILRNGTFVEVTWEHYITK